MRLNSALASTFLFVPIVLADHSPGEHQPRFHNSVNENINDAPGWVSQVPWAGAVLLEGNEACLFRTGSYNFVTGSFEAPSASGDHGFTIALGIGGRGVQCDIAFVVGIDVLVNGNAVSYAAWATFGYHKESPQKFDISFGDTIRASVAVGTATTGSAALENTKNGQMWWGNFNASDSVVCQQSAEWVVTPLANYPSNEMPIPKFSEVTFLDATAYTVSGNSVMPGPGAEIINEIEFNNNPSTTATVFENTVTIASTR